MLNYFINKMSTFVHNQLMYVQVQLGKGSVNKIKFYYCLTIITVSKYKVLKQKKQTKFSYPNGIM